MAQPWAKRFYKSAAWQKCRRSYIANVFGLCEHCSAAGRTRPGYIVDHIIELTPENINNPDITLNHENLQYLCLECHNRKTFRKIGPTRDGLRFDENGNLVKVE